MLINPHPCQQYAGPQHSVLHLQQEVTRPKATFKHTSPAKSGLDGELLGANNWQRSLLHRYTRFKTSLPRNFTFIRSSQYFVYSDV